MRTFTFIIAVLIVNTLLSQPTFESITSVTTGNSGYTCNNVKKIEYDQFGNRWMLFSNYWQTSNLAKYNGIDWEYYNSNNYPFNNIHSFTFDLFNNLWIGDYNNVWKYDGNNWINFNFPSIIDFSSCYADSIGNVYFSTNYSGIVEFNDTNYSFITNSSNGLYNDQPFCIFVDNQQRLWSGHNGGISIYNGLTCSSLSLPQSGLIIYDITQDNSGDMWIATDIGIYNYNGTNWSFFNPGQLFNISSHEIFGIETDDLGNIWAFFPEHGCVNFDGINWNLFNDGQGMNTDFINSIYCENNNKIWICTKDMGINIYENQQWTFINTLDGMSNNFITSMEIDINNNLWLGTNQGIINFDGNNWTNYFYKLGEPNIQYYVYFNNYMIQCINNGYNGKLWFGGYCGYPNGAAYYIDSVWNEIPYDIGSDILTGNIYQILDDSINITWFATENALNKMEKLPNFTFPQWTVYKTQDGLLDNKTTALLKDFNGNLIIGTWGGLNVYDGNNFSTISMLPISNQINKQVTALIEDTLNRLWVGTTNGLGCYDGQNWTAYDTLTGLAGNYITSLYLAADSTLWVSTNNGISWFDGTNFTSYYKSDGLIADSITDIVEDHDGNMYFSSMYGLSKVSACNSVNEINHKTKLSLFPNPASTTIKVSAKEIINSIEVYNLNGILLRTISCKSNVQTIDISDLPAGSYFVRVLGKDSTWIEKFVVIR